MFWGTIPLPTFQAPANAQNRFMIDVLLAPHWVYLIKPVYVEFFGNFVNHEGIHGSTITIIFCKQVSISFKKVTNDYSIDLDCLKISIFLRVTHLLRNKNKVISFNNNNINVNNTYLAFDLLRRVTLLRLFGLF